MEKTIILIHEIYGITESLRQLKKQVELEGYPVILPSLYPDNYRGTDEHVSYRKFFSAVGIKNGFQTINDIINEHTNQEIILIGFSVGATIAWLHSSNPKVDKVIGIYGSRIRNYLDITPLAKTYLYFTKEKSFDINATLDILQAKNNVTAKLIDGEHGFYNSRETNKHLTAKLDQQIMKLIS